MSSIVMVKVNYLPLWPDYFPDAKQVIFVCQLCTLKNPSGVMGMVKFFVRSGEESRKTYVPIRC